MSKEDNYYVYAKYKECPIANPFALPFYVGKGRYGRINSMSGRSKHYKSTVAKYGNHSLKFAEEVPETEAMQTEAIYIALFGRADKKEGSLINLTDGGDGTSTYWTPEARLKQSKVKTEQLKNPEILGKALAALDKARNDPAAKDKFSTSIKKHYDDSANVERQRIGTLNQFADPVKAGNHRAAQQLRYSTTEGVEANKLAQIRALGKTALVTLDDAVELSALGVNELARRLGVNEGHLANKCRGGISYNLKCKSPEFSGRKVITARYI